ncbi:hypothetical protein [Marivita sp.]
MDTQFRFPVSKVMRVWGTGFDWFAPMEPDCTVMFCACRPMA